MTYFPGHFQDDLITRVISCLDMVKPRLLFEISPNHAPAIEVPMMLSCGETKVVVRELLQFRDWFYLQVLILANLASIYFSPLNQPEILNTGTNSSIIPKIAYT